MLPEAARGDDDAAAVAFVEHWVELVNYALVTGDTAPARQSAPGCSTCEAVLDDIESTFGQQEPGQWELLTSQPFAPQGEDQATTDRVVVAEINTNEDREGATGELTCGLVQSGGGWAVAWLDAEEL
ncbi:hypothetical protein GCM10027215_25310 [Nocardioides zeae]